eukprot:m.126652 g.126652  ORF g.126652 m.126652 type:complete len:63 (-) comp13838_c0_seq4:175-363(-)
MPCVEVSLLTSILHLRNERTSTRQSCIAMNTTITQHRAPHLELELVPMFVAVCICISGSVVN